MSITLALLVLPAVASLVWWYWTFLHFNKYLKKYSGPFPLPVIGNTHNFGDGSELLQILKAFTDKYGPVYKLILGYRPRLIISEAKTVEFLLTSKHVEKSYEYKCFVPWLGRGLFTSTGKMWRQQRKLITPTFHFQILEQFVEVFRTKTNILIQNLQKEAGQKPVNIMPYINCCTLDIICEFAMGTSVNAQNNCDSEYVRSVKEMCRIIIERTVSYTKMWDILFKFSKDQRKQNRALEVLHGYTDSVIKTRRKKLMDANTTAILKTKNKQKLALLDLLLQSTIDGKPLSDETIREEVDTILFGGHDTLTSAIVFTLYCLSQHRTIQENAVEELRQIFPDNKSRPLTCKDLQNMKYLSTVIKESLRLYPPIPIFGRVLHEDAVFDGEILPKGLVLSVFTYGLHRNPDYYSNPDEFNPERFSSGSSNSNLTYAYVPFSAGPRSCIGQRFANMETKFIVAEILRNFELLPVPNHKLTLIAAASLQPKNGLPIYFRKRNFL